MTAVQSPMESYSAVFSCVWGSKRPSRSQSLRYSLCTGKAGYVFSDNKQPRRYPLRVGKILPGM